MHRWIWFCMVAILCVPPNLVAAAQIDSVRLGWDGHYKRMRWLPIQIEVRTEGQAFVGELVVEFLDPYSDETLWIVKQALALPIKSRRTFRLSAFAHWREALLRCQLRDDADVVEADVRPDLLPPLDDNTMLIAVLAADKRGFAPLNRAQLDGDVQTKLIYVSPEDLSVRALDHGSIDVLVLKQHDLAYPLQRSQEDALLNWVATGGVFLSISSRPATLLADWLPLHDFQTRTIPEPVDTQAPLVVRANHWLTGTPHPNASVLLRIQEDPVLAERQVDRGKTLFLGVEPAQIVDGWQSVLHAMQTQAQKEQTKTVLREHEQRLNTLLTRQPGDTSPLTRRMMVVGGLLIAGLIAVHVATPLRRFRLVLVLLWAAGLGSTTLALAYFRAPVVEAEGMAWCELYPQTQRLDVHVAAGLRVPRSTRARLDHTADWYLRPFRWKSPLDAASHISPDSNHQFRLMLSPWRPRPLLIESMRSYPYRVELTDDTCCNRLPFMLRNTYLLSKKGWSSLGDLAPGQTAQVRWQALGNWPQPQTPSSRHTAFLNILLREGVIPFQTEQSLMLGWADLNELDLDDAPVEVKGDALIVIHVD